MPPASTFHGLSRQWGPRTADLLRLGQQPLTTVAVQRTYPAEYIPELFVKTFKPLAKDGKESLRKENRVQLTYSLVSRHSQPTSSEF